MQGSRLALCTCLVTCLVMGLVMSACDSKEIKRDELEAAAAAALGPQGKDDATKEIEAKEAEERRKAFEKRQAEEAAAQAKLDEIATRVVKAPAKPSKNLVKSCDDLIVIYEEWIKKVYFDDDAFQLNFFDNKKKNLGVVKAKCAKLQSIPVTDCWMEVIRLVSAPEFSEEDAKLLQAKPDFLFDQCIKQFAPEKLE
jgi:hypothetical protein